MQPQVKIFCIIISCDPPDMSLFFGRLHDLHSFPVPDGMRYPDAQTSISSATPTPLHSYLETLRPPTGGGHTLLEDDGKPRETQVGCEKAFITGKFLKKYDESEYRSGERKLSSK